jgi:hypothetical protein
MFAPAPGMTPRSDNPPRWSMELPLAIGVGHEGPVEHDGGDRSVYFEDPEGNVVEAWDFVEHGEGAADGVEALG